MSYFYYESKKIYYTETGCGKPVLFLHGNTASSRMFEPLQPLYAERFHVILMDFLGHGKSERLEKFPAELWLEESRRLLLLGSAGDEMLRIDFQEEYRGIAAETGAAVTVFPTGNHPAILSNAERAADIICRFLK